MAAVQKELEALVPVNIRNNRSFIEISRDQAFKIIGLIEKSLKFPTNDFDWDAMRGLLDYYSDTRSSGSGKILLLAETGRKLHREKSGDKSGLSILGGGGELRRIVTDPKRSLPALVLLQQEGTRELGWSGFKFWWPILAAPGTVQPCVFAAKVALD